MSRQYLYQGKALLPINGNVVKKDYSGEAFICTKGRGVFQVSFDGQSWSDWQKGLGAPIAFNSLYFRSLPGAASANEIEFYNGTILVADSRLNVIDDTDEATIFTKPSGFTIVSVFAPAGPAEPVIVNLTNPDNSNLLALRSIQWGVQLDLGRTGEGGDASGGCPGRLESRGSGLLFWRNIRGHESVFVIAKHGGCRVDRRNFRDVLERIKLWIYFQHSAAAAAAVRHLRRRRHPTRLDRSDSTKTFWLSAESRCSWFSCWCCQIENNMGQASSSSSAATGINAPGGSITKNSPGVIALVIVAVVIVFYIYKRRAS